ncbi:UNVERIFIED_CONTAM: hypothetical protein Sindi_1998600 [Sesamum indicum]
MWGGEGECENSQQVTACPTNGRARRRWGEARGETSSRRVDAPPSARGAAPPPSSRQLLGLGGEAPPPARGGASGWGAEAPPSGGSVLGFVWDNLPPYLEGYSPNHIAAIMSLPKCSSFDLGENLEDLSDFELDSMGFRRSEQCDDMASDGEAASGRSKTDDEVVSEDEETKLKGRSVVVALGVDGRRPDIPGYRVPHCRTVDIGTCDNVLTREQLVGIRVTYRVPSANKFILSSRGRRIRDPSAGCFTIYTTYFVIQSYGICVSQLTPNAFMCFEGWQRRLLELKLPLTLENFHALWIVRCVAEVSVSSYDGRYFYFTPQKACRFLKVFVSSKGPWKEKFFYVRDNGWGLASEWSSSAITITHRKEFEKLRQGCMAAGLFSRMVDVAHYFPSGKKLEINAARAQKAAVREQKRRDQESAPPQVGSSVSIAPHGVSTGSRHSGSLPTPLVGPSPPPKMQRGAFSLADGDACDAGASHVGGASSYWSRTRGIMSEEDLSQVADLSEEQMDELLAENMARALVVTTATKNQKAARMAEMKHLEAALEQREGDFSWLKKERDDAWGILHLGSVNLSARSTESEEFETIITDKEAPNYDDAIRRCHRVLRQTLREKGRIVEEDIGLLDPEVSRGEEKVVEVANG